MKPHSLLAINNPCARADAGWYSSDATAPSKQDAMAVLARAHELGVGFFNTSDIYGPFSNEELIGARHNALALCGLKGTVRSALGWVPRRW